MGTWMTPTVVGKGAAFECQSELGILHVSIMWSTKCVRVENQPNSSRCWLGSDGKETRDAGMTSDGRV